MNCCVCYTKNYTTKTSCKHIICIQCLMNLKKFVCPMCRKDLFKELPPNLQSYLKSKNCQRITNKPLYMRIEDPEEFPPLPTTFRR